MQFSCDFQILKSPILWKDIDLLVFLQLLRMYWRKYDSENPPIFDESTIQRHHKDNDPYELREKYYQYGVKPEWMQVDGRNGGNEMTFCHLHPHFICSRRLNVLQTDSGG